MRLLAQTTGNGLAAIEQPASLVLALLTYSVSVALPFLADGLCERFALHFELVAAIVGGVGRCRNALTVALFKCHTRRQFRQRRAMVEDG